MEARKQGQPSRSKLDAHEAFILGLIENAPDITLAEIGERLAAERGVRAVLLVQTLIDLIIEALVEKDGDRFLPWTRNTTSGKVQV
ncbi:hypothetical protein B5V01_21870 [Mesorhizobium erdmanii]|uniref:Uncharacterized protein n=2 Tax=Mesorhizobium TaxID=68287 RepID=A0A3M9X3R5_9HYPH|nr:MULTISPECIES: hypothetical protein [Mesorhizobium]RNJ42684.1 hypothetical protein DNR46_26485 [Mesorhizobium japonicum]RXT42551.1 hypothetical protein B5V01_21870 [Mesorhizobium erdmanii]